MRKAEPTAASTAVIAQSLGPRVTRSLYRSLLHEANKLDRATVSKVLLPVPRKLQTATGLTGPLYVPNGVKYADLVKRAFKVHKPGEKGNPLLAFEALNMFRAHAKTVESLIGVATKEHENMVKALGEANPDTSQYWAKPILDPVQMQRIQQERMEDEIAKNRRIAVAASSAENSASSGSEKKTTEKIKVGVDIPDRLSHRSPQQEKTIRELFASTKVGNTNNSSTSSDENNNNLPKPATKADVLAKLGTVEPRVGMGLVAHPLSSSHIDRRVILIVDTNPQTTTGLVLDMFYTYPLSHGNPMFPEVFWGHEVYNGGYCHVDFTMPPTANVSILHTLPPPSDTNTNPSYNARWLSWALRQATGGGTTSGSGANDNATNKKSATGSPTAHHERLCKPIIKGDGKDIPTLYYSKVEALPYLSSLVPGQNRSDLRVYWGCMRWSTIQLTSEIKNGHWIPVDISPKFFAAYPVVRPGDGNMSQHVVDTFPTEDMLRESKDLRKKLLGADVVPPQTFPPDQPVCRRESLWDQIVLALGGEYKSLVGSVNPFVTKQQQQQAAAAGNAVDSGAAPPRRLAESAKHLTPSQQQQTPSKNSSSSSQQGGIAAASSAAAAAASSSSSSTHDNDEDNNDHDLIDADDGFLESREGASIVTDEDELPEMDIDEMIDVFDPDNHHPATTASSSSSASGGDDLTHPDDHHDVEEAMKKKTHQDDDDDDDNNKNRGGGGAGNSPPPPSV